MKKIVLTILLLAPVFAFPQNKMTPELLLKLGRVNGLGISKDGKYVVYSVTTPNVEENNSKTKSYIIPITGGTAIGINNPDSLLINKNLSSDGSYLLSSREVKEKKISGSDYYPELAKSNVYVFDNLDQRHWDQWEDGKFDHVFITPTAKPQEEKDIMAGEPYDCPQKPFGGGEDFIWSPDGKHVVYVTKKKFGKDYAISTNTDLYDYDITTGETKDLTENRKGYDVSPAFSNDGTLAWISLERDGYESDKADIVASTGMGVVNLTKQQDLIHVAGFRWSEDGKNIFFWAPINGTEQLFEVDYTGATQKLPEVRQITNGDFDITGMVGQAGNVLIVSRCDMNHATELYAVDIGNGNMKKLTYVNDSVFDSIDKCKTERRWVTTTDNKKMLVWVIYPPGFDSTKKYPTLLYCQGGPQAPLTQAYSYRWNFQLIASQGYIVVAPNRRGMPGHGTKWNEQVSKDWGGQVMKDYLSAIDAVS
ncbi:MAG TPA: prolyl oligopeptidase family serine peptidase, partial [Chitinophagaceae bacterium]